ncbi:hypothetical protein ILUMI_14956 [Ignelater luminosus]|uniref:Harbinger transposase-derived nuclease n=1 Tax=Ignelater luminosus TaxID=2038154 RepID=A0A8K0CVL3_IGNLU|nr:hypothetical protein ILUMI_14956 [Ignelater luminosus]
MNLYNSSSESEDEEGRRSRNFKPRVNFAQITDSQQCLEQFRMCAEAIEYVLQVIGGDLQHNTERNRTLTPQQQLLTALNWLGNGAQYHGVADIHGLHKSTVQRCVQNVCQKIVTKLFPEEIRWRTGEALASLPQQFMAVAGFPRVSGCIDGSLILIDNPKLNEKAYVNRNGDHSINVIASSFMLPLAGRGPLMTLEL